MQKILVAVDAVNLNINTLDFACYLGRLTNSVVTGVFLENEVAEEQLVIKKMYDATYITTDVDVNSPEYIAKRKSIENNITLFKQACESRSVRCVIHRDREVPAKEIIKESRFADLIVADAEISFEKSNRQLPTSFVKDLLKDAECPVFMAAEKFEAPEEVIFTYDGSSSSVFAIRQFTYLFPQFDELRAIVLHINKEGVWDESEKNKLKELMQHHYSAIGFEILKGNSHEQLFDYLFKRKRAFIVMGAYGRKPLSQLIRKSSADLLLRTITQPIFIAHY